VGLDDDECCWKLADFPDKHDILPFDLTLTGATFGGAGCTSNRIRGRLTSATGALSPFGVPTYPGQFVKGSTKANSTLNRFQLVDREGTYEVFATGFRHPFGIAFSPPGGLFVVDNGPDLRGCRPIGNGAPDNLWEVHQGDWMGWPDVFGGYGLENPGLSLLNGS